MMRDLVFFVVAAAATGFLPSPTLVHKRVLQQRRSGLMHKRGGAQSSSSSPMGEAASPEVSVSRVSEGTLLVLLSSIVGVVFLSLVLTRDLSSPPPFLALREIAAGGVAAATAEIALYPIEVLKVRMQTGLGGQNWQKQVFTLRRPGVVAGTLRALAYHGLRLGLFPFVNRLLEGISLGEGFGRKVLVGAACGALGACLCNPLDLAKTRLQRDPKRYANSIDALLTFRKEGGYFVGAPASIARAAAGSSAQLATYDFVKATFGATTIASVLVGAVAASCAYVTAAAPFDVVKSRLMVARAQNKRPTLFEALITIVKDEGISALFRGWLPSLLRLLPTTLVVFPLLERLRIILGAGAF